MATLLWPPPPPPPPCETHTGYAMNYLDGIASNMYLYQVNTAGRVGRIAQRGRTDGGGGGVPGPSHPAGAWDVGSRTLLGHTFFPFFFRNVCFQCVSYKYSGPPGETPPSPPTPQPWVVPYPLFCFLIIILFVAYFIFICLWIATLFYYE